MKAREDTADEILIGNMTGNNIERVVENRNVYRSVHPLGEDDQVLPWIPLAT